MRIVIKTPVEQALPQVWAGFDRRLFEQLTPVFPPVRIIQFDGCLQGDVVHLRLHFILFRQDWVSLIVDQQTGPDEIYFIDQGTRLPFFLSYWKHRHRLCRKIDPKTGLEQTVIIDDITFRTPFWVTNFLVYPVLWGQFACRKFVYQRIFTRN